MRRATGHCIASGSTIPTRPPYVSGTAGQIVSYLDPNSGALVQRVDAAGHWRRWLFSGLHRLDFTAWMRSRPSWDILMWLTLLGGVAVSLTGSYLAIRRIRRDVTMLLRLIAKRHATARPRRIP